MRSESRDERDSYSVLIDREISDELRQTFVHQTLINMGQRLMCLILKDFCRTRDYYRGDGQVVQSYLPQTHLQILKNLHRLDLEEMFRWTVICIPICV